VRKFSRRQQIVVLAIGILLLGLPSLISLFNISSKTIIPDKTEVFVECVGDVARPGIYSFLHEPTVYEVINKAGGLGIKGSSTESVDPREGLTPLRDPKGLDVTKVESGCRLDVDILTAEGVEIYRGRMDGQKLLFFDLPVDLKKATVSDLMSIPGISKTLAESIIQFRDTSKDFRTLDDLRGIEGIGEKRFHILKKHLVFE
jgi:hypothetical protein